MTHPPYDAPEVPALGAVVDAGRGSLPFALVRDESLVACAAWALGDAGITAVDASVPWVGIQEAGEPFVLHDALCPLTPAAFLAACVRLAVEEDVVVVGVREVTDTVKRLEGDRIGATVDRAGLLEVWSPIVLPASVCARLDEPDTTSFAALVADLRAHTEVQLVTAPPEARRVSSPDDLRLLEALSG